MYFGNATILNSGGALSVKHERVAEIIKDLDDTLELAYIPEDQRSVFDRHPFAVIQKRSGFPDYVVMTMPENEVDERVIAKLIMRDTHRGSVIDELDAQDAAIRLMDMRSRMDEFEEKKDLAKSILKSPKHTYKHGGRVYH